MASLRRLSVSGSPPPRAVLAVGERQLACLLERDKGEPPSPSSRPVAADDEPLHPAPRAGGLHLQVQPVAVAIAAGPETLRTKVLESAFFGMPAPGLALARSFR